MSTSAPDPSGDPSCQAPPQPLAPADASATQAIPMMPPPPPAPATAPIPAPPGAEPVGSSPAPVGGLPASESSADPAPAAPEVPVVASPVYAAGPLPTDVPVQDVPVGASYQAGPSPAGTGYGAGSGYGAGTGYGADPAYGAGPVPGGTYPEAVHRDGFLSALFDLSFARYVTITWAKVVYILAMVGIGLTWFASALALGFTVGAANSLYRYSSSFSLGAFLLGLLLGIVPAFFHLLMVRLGLEVVVAVVRTEKNTRRHVEHVTGQVEL